MGNEEHRLAGGRAQARQLLLQRQAGHGVDCGERFVHQDHVGIGGPGTRHRHALAHAAGKFMRIAVLEAVQTHQVDQTRYLLLAFGLRHTRDFQPMADVSPHGAPRQDGQFLEYDAAFAAWLSHQFAVAMDGAFGRTDETGHRL